MTKWVVVGGGSAGCVVAARLSERRGDEVVLLEAGPDHGAIEADDDVGPFLTDPDRLRTDEVSRRPGTGAGEYLRGHGLGGSSLINGGVVTDPASPTDPRLPMQTPWRDGPVGGALLQADTVARRVRLVRRDDRRVDAADAFLRPVMVRPNLEVRTDTDVHRVLVADRRVVGVETGGGRTIAADRVVMCAGAIHTPVILLRSGVDTPGIGDGLEDHPSFTIALRLRPDEIDPGSPMIAVAANHPDHQIVALDHVGGAPGFGAIVVALVRTRGRGWVRLRDGSPSIELAGLSEAVDAELMTRAVERTITLFEHAAWQRIVAEAYVDDCGTTLDSIASSTASIRSWVVDHATGHFHAAATCRDGVVTDDGVVRGYEGLYVADASALPALPRYDPYLHVVIQADRLASSW